MRAISCDDSVTPDRSGGGGGSLQQDRSRPASRRSSSLCCTGLRIGNSKVLHVVDGNRLVVRPIEESTDVGATCGSLAAHSDVTTTELREAVFGVLQQPRRNAGAANCFR